MATIPTDPKQLTPQEWNKLHSQALQLYKDSIWHLADVLALGKKKFGRNILFDLTTLSPNKVKWLVAIAETPRNPSLLPEHHGEVVGIPDARKWLQRAVKDELDPVELRKAIRSGHKKVKKVKETEIPTWSKNFLLMEKDLKSLPPDQQQRIKDYIKGKLDEGTM